MILPLIPLYFYSNSFLPSKQIWISPISGGQGGEPRSISWWRRCCCCRWRLRRTSRRRCRRQRRRWKWKCPRWSWRRRLRQRSRLRGLAQLHQRHPRKTLQSDESRSHRPAKGLPTNGNGQAYADLRLCTLITLVVVICIFQSPFFLFLLPS